MQLCKILVFSAALVLGLRVQGNRLREKSIPSRRELRKPFPHDSILEVQSPTIIIVAIIWLLVLVVIIVMGMEEKVSNMQIIGKETYRNI